MALEILSWLNQNYIWLSIGVLAFILLIALGVWIRNKYFVYLYKVRLFKTRENGKVKEHNCVGGYIARKNAPSFFRVKTGRWWWQYVDFYTTPNPKYMDEEDRVYYKQIDIKSYIQLRRMFEDSVFKYAPVESDVAYGAILDISRIDQTLVTESKWQKLAPYVGLVLVFIAAIIGWWFVMKAKCPTL